MKVKEESENVGLKLNTVVLFPYSDQKKKKGIWYHFVRMWKNRGILTHYFNWVFHMIPFSLSLAALYGLWDLSSLTRN